MNGKKLDTYLNGLLDGSSAGTVPEGVPGCALKVWRDHREIYAFEAGTRDFDRKIPFTSHK